MRVGNTRGEWAIGFIMINDRTCRPTRDFHPSAGRAATRTLLGNLASRQRAGSPYATD